MRRVLVASAAGLLALAVAGCSASRRETSRGLPEDRRAPVVYVALGDSTVEGVAASSPSRNYVSRIHERLRAVYPAARLANLGSGGAVSADVVASQLVRAVELKPDLVTLSVGPNDITKGIAVKEYERNIDTIFRKLNAETGALVVVNLLPDLAVTPRFRLSDKSEAVGRLTVSFNDALVRKAREHGVDVVDLYAASREEVPRRPELIASDGYHPSDVGYARWAELMWARVEPRIAAR